jgi:xanthine dehydrogenase accessory factor
MDSPRVMRFLAGKLDRGLRCVLVTVVAVEGSSMRDPGTHMGVCEDGNFSGSLSGGCIEHAVVAEALAALAQGAARIVRFGAGSPYLDIRLPCGGGLDIHFQPLASAALVAGALRAMDARRPFSVSITPDGATFEEGWHQPEFDFSSGRGRFGHWPQARLALIGHGAGSAALARLAQTLALAVEVLSPDANLVGSLCEQGIDASRLDHATDTSALHGDRWTAFAFLFHDHDWELALMRRALELPHFYIGAMGGRRAHALRRDALAKAGVPERQIETIRAPIGLFHSSRDPDTLALSTLADIVKAYQDTDFEAALV